MTQTAIVEGSVSAGGDVTLSQGSQVNGTILVSGGDITLSQSSSIIGNIIGAGTVTFSQGSTSTGSVSAGSTSLPPTPHVPPLFLATTGPTAIITVADVYRITVNDGYQTYECDVWLTSDIDVGNFLDGCGGSTLPTTGSAPTVSILSPAAAATLVGTTTVQVGATDPQDAPGTLTVELSIDGGAFTTMTYNATTSVYEGTWDTTAEADGSHTLDARATDSLGIKTDAALVPVTVDNIVEEPTAAISNPIDGSTVTSTITVQVNATDVQDATGNLTVQVSIDGGSFVTTTYNTTTQRYEYSWDTTGVSDGNHTIDARATDSSANTTNATRVSVSVDNVDGPPTASISSPLSGATVSGTTTVRVTATDQEDTVGTLTVQVSFDSGAYASSTTYDSGSATYQLTWNTTSVSDGTHTIGARAIDNGGKTTTSTSTSVTVNNAGATSTTSTLGGFTWFTNAIDVSTSTTSTWVTLDLSAHVGASTTGVVMEIVHTAASIGDIGVVRGTEDTRDYMSTSTYEEIESKTHRWQIVKVDSSLRIQGYISSGDIDFKLLGYTTGLDPVYFTTPPDITPTTTAVWTAVDVSSYVDTDADGVILLIDSVTSTDQDYGVRESGSTYSTTNRELEEYGNSMYLVGIDASDRFEVYLASTFVQVYLVGQTKGSVVYYKEDVAVTDPITGSYQTLDLDNFATTTNANGLVFYASMGTAVGDAKLNFRHGDSTDDWNGDIGAGTHLQAMMGIKSNGTWDEHMASTQSDVYIAAYTKPP